MTLRRALEELQAPGGWPSQLQLVGWGGGQDGVEGGGGRGSPEKNGHCH